MKLAIRSLSKSYTIAKEKTAGTNAEKTIYALRNCTMDIEGGGVTVIVGQSGCGKTTLLKTIAGLEQADSGTVEFTAFEQEAGKETTAEKTPKTGFMFQDPRLLPWLTVEQNLALAFARPKNKMEKTFIQNKIMEVLAMVGLAGRGASLPQELSGGMARRAALARCLCRNPRLLLLDEPLSNLDAFTRIKLREELEKLWQQLGITVILVTHDIEDAVFFGGRVFLMNEGTIENETDIPLSRPRDCRSAEFQKYCQTIEEFNKNSANSDNNNGGRHEKVLH